MRAFPCAAQRINLQWADESSSRDDQNEQRVTDSQEMRFMNSASTLSAPPERASALLPPLHASTRRAWISGLGSEAGAAGRGSAGMHGGAMRDERTPHGNVLAAGIRQAALDVASQ
ncbi:unnamed protein product [Closterium sp. Yama58-4]|nr:unnamed protein product [Closterium sp. Yama58-4]